MNKVDEADEVEEVDEGDDVNSGKLMKIFEENMAVRNKP